MKRKPLAKLTNHLRYKNEKSLYKKAIQIAREAAWNNVYEKESDPFGKIKQFVFGKYKDESVYPFSNEKSLNLFQGLPFFNILQSKFLAIQLKYVFCQFPITINLPSFFLKYAKLFFH